ncbi:UBX domain-containing protein 7-like [Contarinia nasturtii]|uniref:UBX domain-containing protein 7-like n=1 Tax=Contarinia nasturtii TaxID=265458 RepID=UPI0012D3B6F8|nr:UBX domain-containing protein 7-like [Contarinia nasturtii]
MSEESEQNNQIALFMEISGADFDTARQALTVNNFNLEQAINYHLERSNAIGAPEDDVAAASTSTDANLPIDDDDEVRPPILPKREQLILPNEDNFRYRKRLTTATRTVCPLRNFELEGRMQEERLKAVVMGNISTTGIDPSDVDESINYLTKATASNPKENILGFSNSTRELFNRQLNASAAQPSTKSTVPSRLSELFRPPVDMTFCGSFQAARDYAKEQNKWLIVNVQDMSDFNCQVLNRDIWSSDKLREIIKRYFVFWQVAIDNTDGHRFQVFYGIQVFPYVGIIDPRTGEEKLCYKTGFKLTLNDFMDKLKIYLKENTPHPNADDGIVSTFDEKYFETKTTNSTNNHATASPNPKRKRLEPSSLTEQEQIELAIAHSLREVNAAEDDNKSDSFGEPSSDESDFDFDDESSNQSYVKSQTSQTVSEKSNTFDNKIAEQECDSKVGEATPSTAPNIETYDNYLGDENDAKARIQLRLPSGDRHMFEWPCTTKLKALKLYIPFKYPELTSDPYKVICPFVGGQSNNILDMDDALTLKEANLYPTVILHLRNED